MRPHRIRGRIFLLPFLVLAVGAVILFHSFTRSDAGPLFLTPYLDDNKGWEIYRLMAPGRRRP